MSAPLKQEQVLQLARGMPAEQKMMLLSGMLIQLKKHQKGVVEDLLTRQRVGIPLGVFSQDKLSCLEAIVKYLKETKAMSFNRISKLLNRDNRTIWATYSNTMKKMPEPLDGEGEEMPASLIADRRLSVLENVVAYAKSLGKTNHEVALLLHLDDRTIWSAYDKVKKKKGGLR